MLNAQCSVVGCHASFANLRKWKQKKCQIHHCRRTVCPCPAPYRLIHFPKDPELKLSWEKRVNRIETVDRIVKYGKRIYHHTKGDVWKANPTDVICTTHFKEGEPTPIYPCPTEKMGQTRVYRSPKKRKSPKHRNSENKTLNECSSDKNSCPVASCDDHEYNIQRPNAIEGLHHDHTYHVSICHCTSTCCSINQQKLSQCYNRISSLERTAYTCNCDLKRVIVHKQVIEV